MFAVCGILLMAVSRRVVWFLMRLIIRLCAKLYVIKDPESAAVKWRDGLNTFHNSIMMLKDKPLDFLFQLMQRFCAMLHHRSHLPLTHKKTLGLFCYHSCFCKLI